MQSRRRAARFGQLLRAAQFVLMILTVGAFLGFVFADNLASMYYGRTIRRQLSREGLHSAHMRATPPEGFALVATTPLEGDLHGSSLAADEDVLWIVDAASGLLRFDLRSETVSHRIGSEHLNAPRGVSSTEDGILIVTDLEGERVVYIDDTGSVKNIRQSDDLFGNGQIARAVESDTGLLYVLDDTRVSVWPIDQAPRTFFVQAEQYDLKRWGGHLFTTGSTVNGQSVSKLTSTGMDLFQGINPTRLWALPFWDVPFVGLDVDDDGFITLVDKNGHLVQLDQEGTVLHHLPPIDGGPGPVRSITDTGSAGLIVVHEAGLRRYNLTWVGQTMRRATSLSRVGRNDEAISLLQQIIDEEPHLAIVRRALAEAYLAVDEPLLAAKQYVLIDDRGGFREAMDDVATRLRKERLWALLTIFFLITVAIWVLNKAWPALTFSKSDGEI